MDEMTLGGAIVRGVVWGLFLLAGREWGYRKGLKERTEARYLEGLEVGQRQGIDLAKLHQAGKDSARARKAAATRKQRAAIRELANDGDYAGSAHPMGIPTDG